MSTRTVVYGCIEECPGAIHHRERFDRLLAHNRRVIEALPIDHDWPPLTRNMFCLTGSDYPQPGFHKTPILHFGASFRGVEESGWDIWLRKFERLLAQLFWEEAHAQLILDHVPTGLIESKFQYQWTAKPEVVHRVFTEGRLVPMNEWTFDGGPRCFGRPEP
jgi:hypothetical protein